MRDHQHRAVAPRRRQVKEGDVDHDSRGEDRRADPERPGDPGGLAGARPARRLRQAGRARIAEAQVEPDQEQREQRDVDDADREAGGKPQDRQRGDEHEQRRERAGKQRRGSSAERLGERCDGGCKRHRARQPHRDHPQDDPTFADRPPRALGERPPRIDVLEQDQRQREHPAGDHPAEHGRQPGANHRSERCGRPEGRWPLSQVVVDVVAAEQRPVAEAEQSEQRRGGGQQAQHDVQSEAERVQRLTPADHERLPRGQARPLGCGEADAHQAGQLESADGEEDRATHDERCDPGASGHEEAEDVGVRHDPVAGAEHDPAQQQQGQWTEHHDSERLVGQVGQQQAPPRVEGIANGIRQ